MRAVAVTPEKLVVKALNPAPKGEAFELFDPVEIPRNRGWPE
jgi:hypothetical protein